MGGDLTENNHHGKKVVTKMISAGIEPATLSVLTTCDNPYTTKSIRLAKSMRELIISINC